MQSTSSKNLSIETWGLVPYQKAFDRQRDYVSEIIAGTRPQTIVVCQHPPIVTLGRATEAQDVFAWKGETTEVNRGGRATYHGPNQLVLYPLVDLSGKETLNITPKDLHGYMRVLEQALIIVLSLYGIRAQGHSRQIQLDGSEGDATGVWVDNKKIASIGIAVKKWISSHGMAVNLYEDPEAFVGINPCGFQTSTMTSVEKLTGERVNFDKFARELATAFRNLLFSNPSATNFPDDVDRDLERNL